MASKGKKMWRQIHDACAVQGGCVCPLCKRAVEVMTAKILKTFDKKPTNHLEASPECSRVEADKESKHDQ